MYRVISSIEVKDRMVKLITRAGRYVIIDNKDNTINNIIFVNQKDAINFYHNKVATITNNEEIKQ